MILVLKEALMNLRVGYDSNYFDELLISEEFTKS